VKLIPRAGLDELEETKLVYLQRNRTTEESNHDSSDIQFVAYYNSFVISYPDLFCRHIVGVEIIIAPDHNYRDSVGPLWPRDRPIILPVK